jgi:hypothetical protein
MDPPALKLLPYEQALADCRWIASGFLVIGWWIAYWLWPAGITYLPLGEIGLSGALWILASVGVGIGTFCGTVFLAWD